MLPDVGAVVVTGGTVGAYVAAALGGALGALARWGIAEALPSGPAGWPWATLLTNLTGCLLLGVVLGFVLPHPAAPPWSRPFLATGVLGGFTTYSAFAVEVVQLSDGGRPAVAAAYVLVSLAGGVTAVLLGLVAGRPGQRGTS